MSSADLDTSIGLKFEGRHSSMLAFLVDFEKNITMCEVLHTNTFVDDLAEEFGIKGSMDLAAMMVKFNRQYHAEEFLDLTEIYNSIVGKLGNEYDALTLLEWLGFKLDGVGVIGRPGDTFESRILLIEDFLKVSRINLKMPDVTAAPARGLIEEMEDRMEAILKRLRYSGNLWAMMITEHFEMISKIEENLYRIKMEIRDYFHHLKAYLAEDIPPEDVCIEVGVDSAKRSDTLGGVFFLVE
ncbi:hypothetical protein HOE67_01785 [Candidatus Peregrinibacteria bacterium]|jgi:hypothetical protein|nr:hypothetical protein [Candidatus Peregrinibacteria bacterium]MBT4055818.1 hypothetical protein [Candidatus Peregrinibacteria bacterium]